MIQTAKRILPRSLSRRAYNSLVSRPILIVTGMHRSGTSLLVRLLENVGVFMGNRKSRNAESMFFQQVNRDVLDLLGCSWRCIDFLPTTAAMETGFDTLKRSVHRRTEKGLILGHFGMATLRCLSHSSLVWGWKDPRTSLLLPIWRHVFPDATLVHIVRDGRDVARSLSRREFNNWGSDAFDHQERKRRFLADLHLWESYVMRIIEGSALFPCSYTIRYERLLRDPQDEVERLLKHTGVRLMKFKLNPSALIAKKKGTDHGDEEIGLSIGTEDQYPMLRNLGYE